MGKTREKAAWGTYSMVFWRFYESKRGRMRREYSDDTEARRAQRSMLTIKNRKGIREVKITRRRNVLYLEKKEEGRCKEKC